uniref:Protocadherin 2 alpha b 10 n=1 Tax=Sinocyclocheilus anshuiensis TaxID=1608454 RepID=A0A671PI52_9TELE
DRDFLLPQLCKAPPQLGRVQFITWGFCSRKDANDNIPVFSKSLYKTRIMENAHPGTSVVTVHASDADEGLNGEIVYSFIRSDDDDNIANAFTIDSVSGIISIKGNIDYEARNAVEIRVQAKDKGPKPRAAHCKVLVEIVDVNDNVPDISVTSLAETVREDAAAGTMVGLITVKDEDAGENGAVVIKIQYSAPFCIQNTYKNKYSLVVDGPLDRERASEYNCSLPLEAIVNSPLNIYRFEVNVLDSNDNSPIFPTAKTTLNISELAFPGEQFALPSAFDADVGSNSVKSYKLSPNEHFSLDVQSGGEPSVSAELVLQKALDREKQPVIQLTLTAVDGGKPPRSGTMQIIVNVEDINDNIPVFSKSLYKARVHENAPPGTSIIRVQASDPDEGVSGEIVYALVNHNNDKHVDSFLIHPETGEITVKGDVDYERKNAVELRVQAKDKGHKPRPALCKVLLEIVDINDNVPKISVTSLVNTVKEDAPIDTMVGMITVTDKDAGKNGQVTLKIQGSASFKVQKSYKNYYTLVVNGPLDRERASEYNVTITATDEGTPPLSSTSVITVHVSDVNDNAPRFPEPVINVYVKENSQIGAVIHTVSAFDPDVGDNARITYSLLESSKSGPVTSMININSDSGDIHSLQSFNYEEIKTFELKVQFQ